MMGKMGHRLFGCAIVRGIGSGDPGSIFEFLVDKVALGEVSLTLFDFPLPVVTPAVLCIRSSIIRRGTLDL